MSLPVLSNRNIARVFTGNKATTIATGVGVGVVAFWLLPWWLIGAGAIGAGVVFRRRLGF
jgi:hypothetical protein